MKCKGKIQKVFLENIPTSVAGYTSSGIIGCFLKVQITEWPDDVDVGHMDFTNKEVEIIFKD